MREAIAKGLATETREGNRTAERIPFTILENIRVADEHDTLVCQDTGIPIFKVRIGSRVQVDIARLESCLQRACERATAEYPLRSNSVHPLTRKNTGTNTGRGIPVVKLEFVPGSDRIELHVAPKGSGSENMSFLKMLNPSDGTRGIERFVLECILSPPPSPARR